MSPSNDEIVAWATLATAAVALFAGILNLFTLKEMKAARLQSVRPTVIISPAFRTIRIGINKAFHSYTVLGSLDGHDQAIHFQLDNLGERVVLDLEVDWTLHRLTKLADAAKLGLFEGISDDKFSMPGIVGLQEKRYARTGSTGSPHLAGGKSWKAHMPTPVANALALAGLAGISRRLDGSSSGTPVLRVRIGLRTEAGEQRVERYTFELTERRMILNDASNEETVDPASWTYGEATWVAKPLTGWRAVCSNWAALSD